MNPTQENKEPTKVNTERKASVKGTLGKAIAGLGLAVALSGTESASAQNAPQVTPIAPEQPTSQEAIGPLSLSNIRITTAEGETLAFTQPTGTLENLPFPQLAEIARFAESDFKQNVSTYTQELQLPIPTSFEMIFEGRQNPTTNAIEPTATPENASEEAPNVLIAFPGGGLVYDEVNQEPHAYSNIDLLQTTGAITREGDNIQEIAPQSAYATWFVIPSGENLVVIDGSSPTFDQVAIGTLNDSAEGPDITWQPLVRYDSEQAKFIKMAPPASPELAAFTANLSPEQVNEMNTIFTVYPEGNANSVLTSAAEQGIQVTRWNPEFLAFEGTKNGETLYFFPRLGTEGGQRTEQRNTDDLNDGWTRYGGSLISTGYISGQAGVRINLFTPQSYEFKGQNMFLGIAPELLRNQTAIDNFVNRLIQRFPQQIQPGTQINVLPLADDITRIGRDNASITARLAELGGYTLGADGGYVGGKDQVGNTILNRISIHIGEDDTADRVSGSIFTLGILVPFIGAETGYSINSLNSLQGLAEEIVFPLYYSVDPATPFPVFQLYPPTHAS